MHPQVTRRKIILDTDPGGDDALALLWLQSLVQQGLAEWVAVTTAAGNIGAEQTFANAQQLLQLSYLGAEPSLVEVGRSAQRRSVNLATDGADGADGEVGDASHIHGADGIGGLSQTLPRSVAPFATARRSDDLLIEKLQAHPGEITIVAIAPLTNLAAAERKCPGILQQAREIVIMGGAFNHPGNISPEAEFNIAFDPEAAQTVLASCQNIVLIPLDVTAQLIFTPAMAQDLTQDYADSPVAAFIQALTQFMTTTALSQRETRGVPGFLVHDAATLAYLFYPNTLSFQRAWVQVEVTGQKTRGKTFYDRRSYPQATPANAWIATQVDSQQLLAAAIVDLRTLLVKHTAERS